MASKAKPFQPGHTRQQSSTSRYNLSSLRETTMISLKPKLPAELIAAVLDYLPVPDLMRAARVSKRLRDMVYEDTRWIRRLQAMGVWNEAEARQRAEELSKRRDMAKRARDVEARRRAGDRGHNNTNGMAGGGIEGTSPVSTLFDAGWEEQRPQGGQSGQRGSGGFENLSILSPTSPSATNTQPWQGPSEMLSTLGKVRSIRGHAREEYGKVYAALAPFYFDISRSSTFSDLNVFRAFQLPEQQSKMLNQLMSFSRSDTADGWPSRHEQLTSVTSIFETAALREFEQAYNAHDYDGRMKQYATVLVSLNGGSTAINAYIDKNKLMTERNKLGSPSECLQTANTGEVNLLPVRDFFQRLLLALDTEASIINRVFPDSVDMMLPIFERVMDGIITPYITPLFDEARNLGVESYVKVVPGVFEQSKILVQSVKPTKASKPDFRDRILALNNRAFEPHIDLYLQDELDFFKAQSIQRVDAWQKQLSEQQASAESYFMSNVQRQAAKQDFLSSFKKVLMMPVNVLPSRSKETKQLTDGGDPNGATLTPERTDSPSSRPTSLRQDAPTTELAAKAAIMNSKLEGISSLFSIEVALTMTHGAKTSIERMAHFVRMEDWQGEDARKQCEAVFVELMQILGYRHMKPGFDQAVEHLSSYRAREATEHGKSGVKPLVTFLELVNIGDLMQQMVDVFYLQELIAAKLSDQDDFLCPAVKEKKRFEQMIDERVAAGLNRGIDVLIDEVEYICATTQQLSDFNPGTQGDTNAPIVDIGPTKTAQHVVDLVSSHTNMLVGSTDKTMLDVFNQEVGLRLFTALCKHIKRHRISVEGAIKLISDINHYFDYVRTLKNKELLQYYIALRELSQLFLVDGARGKEIAEIIAEGSRYKGVFRTEEVYEFAERRADWYQIKSSVDKTLYSSCIIM